MAPATLPELSGHQLWPEVIAGDQAGLEQEHLEEKIQRTTKAKQRDSIKIEESLS